MQKAAGVSAVGLAWYRRADYPRILQIMADRDRLPPTFDKWQRQAEDFERRTQASGKRVVRAYIDPDEFVAWCAAHGLDVDAEGRKRWGGIVARDAVLGKQD